MGIVDIVNRLKDKEWMGIDGKGPYEVVLFLGIPYYLQSQMLATLKHFAPHAITISLDPFYQPNANWSFPNLSEEEWSKSLKEIIEGLSG
jgi:acetyl-CoA decarbonylase/synthase complex subunit epsilon